MAADTRVYTTCRGQEKERQRQRGRRTSASAIGAGAPIAPGRVNPVIGTTSSGNSSHQAQADKAGALIAKAEKPVPGTLSEASTHPASGRQSSTAVSSASVSASSSEGHNRSAGGQPAPARQTARKDDNGKAAARDGGYNGSQPGSSKSSGSTAQPFRRSVTVEQAADTSSSNQKSSSSWWDSSGSEELFPNSSQSMSSGSDASASSHLSVGLPSNTTTLLVSNIPTFFTQGSLLSMFEDLTPTMRGRYDFFFCPWDEKIGSSLGFALINFIEGQSAASFVKRWQHQHLCGGSKGTKALRVRAAPLQGARANIAKVTEAGSLYLESRFKPLVRQTCIEDPRSMMMVPLDLTTVLEEDVPATSRSQ
eukprot:TRINITY_DN122118_c0_g1_i1.p1 TRINITY_DN122118_c0_g1~~TRINITY_DN122118_c0_g1_i1.p1  ORF type:complete len:416 (+),score=44.02 TRINITY_DN122118_c0_g1_i1:155-1249(+)